MEDYTIVFFYSKFSEACKHAILEMKRVPEFSDVQYVCVDNVDVRKRVTQDGHPNKITYLPYLVRIFNITGHCEVFEGDKVYELISSYSTVTTSTSTTPLTSSLKKKKTDSKTVKPIVNLEELTGEMEITNELEEDGVVQKGEPKKSVTFEMPEYELGPMAGAVRGGVGMGSDDKDRLSSYPKMQDNTIREAPQKSIQERGNNNKIIEEMMRSRSTEDKNLFPNHHLARD